MNYYNFSISIIFVGVYSWQNSTGIKQQYKAFRSNLKHLPCTGVRSALKMEISVH